MSFYTIDGLPLKTIEYIKTYAGGKKQKQHKTVQTNSEGSRVNHQVYQ